MKKAVSIILFVCMVLLMGCNNATSTTEFADQQQFLKDMAKGIENRLAKVDDEKHKNDNDEQKAEYWKELVECELDKVEKYEAMVFSDKMFDRLAHHYISACKMQQTAAMQYKNKTFSSELWSSGRAARAAIITEFYSHYDLPLTGEAAASYAPSNNVVGTAGSSSGKVDYTQYIQDIKITELGKGNKIAGGGWEHWFKFYNASEVDLWFSMDIVYYDAKGTIIDTYNINSRVPSKQTDIGRSLPDVDYDHFSYEIKDIDDNYYPGYYDIVFIPSEPSKGKVIAEVNNTGTSSAYVTAYALFYNGNTFVDAALALGTIPAKGNDLFKFETRKEYTRYEIVYTAYIQ